MSQYLSTVECYDNLSSSWRNYINPLPKPLASTSITIYKNELYVFCGHNGDFSEASYKCSLLKDNVWCTLKSSNYNHCSSLYILK